MIISCINCVKKFEVNSDLIPDDGRLLHCSSCNHEWFFKKIKTQNITKQNPNKKKSPGNDFIKNLDPSVKKNNKETFNVNWDNNDENKDKKRDDNNLELVKFKKKPGLIKLTLVFVISFTALVILIDTFKYPINQVIPNIEFILFNLYETIKDIKSFLIDLL